MAGQSPAMFCCNLTEVSVLSNQAFGRALTESCEAVGVKKLKLSLTITMSKPNDYINVYFSRHPLESKLSQL